MNRHLQSCILSLAGFWLLQAAFCTSALAAARPVWQLIETAAKAPAGTRTRQQETWQLSPSADIQAFRAGERLQVPLPYGHMAEGLLRQTRRTLVGGRSYQIDFAEPGAGLTLHVGLNAAFGEIWTSRDNFVILPGPNGSFRLQKPKQVRQQDHLLTRAEKPVRAKAAYSANAADSTQTDSRLDILYLYDQSMLDEYGWGLPDIAMSEVDYLRLTLANSRVPIDAGITRIEFVALDPEDSEEDILDKAKYEEGVFEDIRQRIEALGADIVSVNQSFRGGSCGWAYLDHPEIERIRVHVNLCHGENGINVLAHETGHNLGLAHGLETHPEVPGFPHDWARGFRLDARDFSSHTWFTSLMAYGLRPQPRLSDPTVECPSFGGVCGIPTNPEDPAAGADAARSLRLYGVGEATKGRPNLRLASSVLPSGRFVARGAPATAFLLAHNPNQLDGADCVIEHHGPFRESFTFQATDPDTNIREGTVNQPVTIAAGRFQTFIVSITPGENLEGVQFAPYAACRNIPMAAAVPGLNTLDLGADESGGPDMVADSRTLSEDGIVEVPRAGVGIFVVATSNLGGPGRITASAKSLDADLPATALVCQTDPAGACLAPPAASVSLDVAAGGTPTFGAFVQTDYATPFRADERFQFQLHEGDVLRGSTSVAIRDAGELQPPLAAKEGGNLVVLTASESSQGSLRDQVSGWHDRYEIVRPPAAGELSLDEATGSWRYTHTGQVEGGQDSFSWRAGNAAGWSEARHLRFEILALPLPEVQSFRLDDDTGARFEVLLDRYLNSIVTDRFVLTEPPDAPHHFDGKTGFLSIDLPETPGLIRFVFQAENRRGLSPSATAEINVLPYDPCQPNNDSWTRWTRRLAEIEVSGVLQTSREEATMIVRALCVTGEPTIESETHITFENGGAPNFIIGMDFPERDTYNLLVVKPREGNAAPQQLRHFPLCKVEGERRLRAQLNGPCPLPPEPPFEKEEP